jgi:hypothetical protein
MFSTLLPSTGLIGASMAGLAAAVSSAIAYAKGMETSQVVVSQSGGVLVLEGKASSYEAIETALGIAHDIADCPVYNRIEPAY